MVNLIFIIAMLLIALIGFLLGFSRTLKFYFRGIFGFIVSIFLCIVLGGMIRNLSIVAGWLNSLNTFLQEKAGFLANWGTIAIYYIALFIVINIIKLIFTKMLIKFFGMNNIFMKIINKLLGLCFAVVMTLFLMWFIISIMQMIDQNKVDDLYAYFMGKNGKILVEILKWNPLKNLFAI